MCVFFVSYRWYTFEHGNIQHILSKHLYQRKSYFLLYHDSSKTSGKEMKYESSEVLKYVRFEMLYKDIVNKEFAEFTNEEKNYLKSVKQYYKNLQDSPCYACGCCDQLHFKKRLSLLKVEDVKEDWLDICYIGSDEEEFYLCKKCQGYMKVDTVPPLARINGFEFPAVPSVLDELNVMEERIISPRITFMLIKQLGVDHQFGLTGGCINVPVDINNTVSVLPRKLNDNYTIHLQLKRRLSDKKAFDTSIVRPKKIFDAAKYLVQTPVYKKYVTLCEDWLDGLDEEINVLPQNTFVSEEDINEISEDSSFDIEENEVLQQPTLMVDDDLPDSGLCVAPGEGKTPLSLMFDYDAEELACPKTYVGQKIVINSGVSESEKNKALMRLRGRRLCKNVNAKMMKFCKQRIRKLSSKVQIALKQKKVKGKVTASDVVSSDFLSCLIQENVGYRVLQEDRSSPAYWQSKKKQLMAMIRQIGPAHIFMSLSAAESEWSELLKALFLNRYGREITEEDIKDLSYAEKVDLIQNDSQTCSEYFDHRTKEIMKLLKQKYSLFRNYPIKDYFIRVEFQHRGMNNSLFLKFSCIEVCIL